MPWVKEDDINLSYEVMGDGFPVLLFAPGGMRSAAAFWGNSPWDPRKVLALSLIHISSPRDKRQTRMPSSA